MIQFVESGEYRTKKVVLKRFVNGVESVGQGFPIEESLLAAFGTVTAINDQIMISLNANDFNNRIDLFKTYLLDKYPFLISTDFINSASGIDNTLCIPGLINSSGSILITNQTEIIIYFDSSGSMNSTLAPLLEMRNTLLKNVMLPFYGNDSALYDERVRIISDGTERTLHFLNNRGALITRPTLILVFQDEANPVYHTSSTILPRTIAFNNDVNLLKNSISLLSANSYRAVIFQVNKNTQEAIQFKNLIQSIENGNINYPDGFNLSDRSEIKYEYDVINGGSPQYYMDKITLKMRELGYRI